MATVAFTMEGSSIRLIKIRVKCSVEQSYGRLVVRRQSLRGECAAGLFLHRPRSQARQSQDSGVNFTSLASAADRHHWEVGVVISESMLVPQGLVITGDAFLSETLILIMHIVNEYRSNSFHKPFTRARAHALTRSHRRTHKWLKLTRPHITPHLSSHHTPPLLTILLHTSH